MSSPSRGEGPDQNPGPAEIKELLRATKTIAVVGLSDNPGRASNHVSAYMQAQGYQVIPVNPALTEALGEQAYPSLRYLPGPVDMVNVFRKPDAVPGVIADAIAVGAKAVWLQEGVVHHEAAAQARAAGMVVVQDRCIFKEHLKAFGGRA